MLQCFGEPRAPESEPRFRALIYKPERLGDFFLAVNAIRAFLRYLGEARSALVVSPECLALANDEFPGLVKLSLPLRLGIGGWNAAEALVLRREFATYSCEDLICLRHHRQPLSSAALRWIPSERRWAVTGHPWMPLASRAAEDGLFGHHVPYPWPGKIGIPTEVQAHADLVGLVTGTTIEAASLLPKIELDQTHGGQPILLVVPWGSSEIKSLTSDLIVQIIRRLVLGGQLSVRIVAERKRRAERERMLRDLHGALPNIDIASEPAKGLQELRAALARASAVLTADTFPAHLAIAMDKPVAVLATGAVPGLFGPWGRSDRQRWFAREMECWGCGWRCVHSKPRCLLDIAPDAVAEFLSRYVVL